jgi:hypothetical protein
MGVLMRAIAIYLGLTVAATAGCLRNTEFRCAADSDCGAGGMCELAGYCSVIDGNCVGTGRAYSDSAGQGLANTCVPSTAPNPGPDAGADPAIDAAIDAPPAVGCPSDYAEVAGSAHRYKALGNISSDRAVAECKRNSLDAYLAIPDDATELALLATVVNPGFWIGLDDRTTEDLFVTQKGVPATFLPWRQGQPDNSRGGEDCVTGTATELEDERCGDSHAAVCECEPVP